MTAVAAGRRRKYAPQKVEEERGISQTYNRGRPPSKGLASANAG